MYSVVSVNREPWEYPLWAENRQWRHVAPLAVTRMGLARESCNVTAASSDHNLRGSTGMCGVNRFGMAWSKWTNLWRELPGSSLPFFTAFYDSVDESAPGFLSSVRRCWDPTIPRHKSFIWRRCQLLTCYSEAAIRPLLPGRVHPADPKISVRAFV